MAKGIVLCYEDVDPGANDNEFTLRAVVAFVGTGVPNSPIVDRGPQENGLPITVQITNLANYPNVVEDALIARATQLGFTLNRNDCLFPSYTRGA